MTTPTAMSSAATIKIISIVPIEPIKSYYFQQATLRKVGHFANTMKYFGGMRITKRGTEFTMMILNQQFLTISALYSFDLDRFPAKLALFIIFPGPMAFSGQL